ncbi:MAG: NYN domain-containing protein [Thermomicrobiales bacterium]
MSAVFRRWMMFVDGENFTVRGQKLAASKGVTLIPGDFHQPDVFLWFPNVDAVLRYRHLEPVAKFLEPNAIRAFYHTSATGDRDQIASTRSALWNLGFTPEVFHKQRGKKAKAVDIALTKDVLSNAFLNNYDILVLMAGDGDYVPLVHEVKRLGKNVFIAHFESPDAGLHPELKLAADRFVAMDDFLLRVWARQSR